MPSSLRTTWIFVRALLSELHAARGCTGRVCKPNTTPKLQSCVRICRAFLLKHSPNISSIHPSFFLRIRSTDLRDCLPQNGQHYNPQIINGTVSFPPFSHIKFDWRRHWIRCVEISINKFYHLIFVLYSPLCWFFFVTEIHLARF